MDILPHGNIEYVVELLAGLVEEGGPLTREQIREHCESLCRAQVRKVVEWMKYEATCDTESDVALSIDYKSLQALRAAGGEG